MVRFIIQFSCCCLFHFFCIYIPIWLDLLFVKKYNWMAKDDNLHSNMVRFIICDFNQYIKQTDIFTFQYG